VRGKGRGAQNKRKFKRELMYSILKTAKTAKGNEIQLIGSPENSNPALIIGVFHGDEPQGKFLIEEYLKIQNSANLLFIPCLNPDGMQSNTRVNSNGVDLNRNFPTKNWEFTERSDFFGGERPASEIETQFVIDVIDKYKPREILTLHAPFKIVNYDGEGKELAKKISEIIHYPVEESVGYPTPGSFGTYAGIEKKIPTITLELDETCLVEDLISPVHKIFDILM